MNSQNVTRVTKTQSPSRAAYLTPLRAGENFRKPLCTEPSFAQRHKSSSLTHSMQKKQLINPPCVHPGFERDEESSGVRGEESSLSLSSDEEPAAEVSNQAVLLQQLTKASISTDHRVCVSV